MVITPKVQNIGNVWSELSGVTRLEKYYIDRSVIEYDVERTIINLQETIKLSDDEFYLLSLLGIIDEIKIKVGLLYSEARLFMITNNILNK